MICPGCKREVHDGAKFCPRCGTVMPRRGHKTMNNTEEIPSEEKPIESPEKPLSAEEPTVEQVTVSNLVMETVVEADVEESVSPSMPPVPPTPPTPPVPPESLAPPVPPAPPTPPMPPTPPIPPVPPVSANTYNQPEVSTQVMDEYVPEPYMSAGGGVVSPNIPGNNFGYDNNELVTDHPEYIEEEKKKGKIWLWVTLGAVAILVLSVLISILYASGVFESIGDKFSSRSARTAESYYDSAIYYDSVAPAMEVTEEVVATDNSYSSDTSYAMGFHKGRNYLDGEMIHTDGRRFPFKVSFDFDPYGTPEITNVVYDNSNYDTKINLTATEFYGSFVRLEGNGGNKQFILQFSGDNPYSGDAWWGDFHQEVELSLR